MKKETWFSKLKNELNATGMTAEERSAVLRYYEEMFQDKLDDGMVEGEILKEFGFPEDVALSVKEDGTRVRPKTANYRTSPDYRPPQNDSYNPYGGDNFAPYAQPTQPQNGYQSAQNSYQPNYGAQNGNQTVQGSVNGNQGTQTRKNFSIVSAVFLSIFAFFFIVSGVGIVIGGVATMVSGFFTGSAAVIVLLLGIGICLAAGGGLLCAAGCSMLKYWKNAGRN